MSDKFDYPVQKSESEWRKQLSPEQYRLLRQAGTEPGGTGKFINHDETGNYSCAGCDQLLFTSDKKFDSHSGWPSWMQPANDDCIQYIEDNAMGMSRTEVVCSACGGHLGHVFNDGPPPTGQRY